MSWGDAFWAKVYDAGEYLRLLHVFLVFMLMLTGVSFLFGRSGTASRLLAYVNLAMILGLGAASHLLYWYAARRATTPA